MVRINKIYTKTGDKGNTHLVGGSMVLKSHPRVKSYGEVDELNSIIGIVLAHANEKNLATTVTPLNSIQQRLFDLGAQLATPANAEPKGINIIKEQDVANLENLIDQACENLPELTSFVLPGGHIVNAYLHLARTVCRRLERTLVELKNSEPIGDFVLEYVNRLSDYLFALARKVSAETKTPEVLWLNIAKAEH